MEYLDGVTLSDKMKAEGRLPAQQLLSMLRPLMEDIGKLHASGIIHRDISPDNIMWMPDNTLKLLDFGCARSMEDGKSMSVLLKHGFAPVEQYQTRGPGALDGHIFPVRDGILLHHRHAAHLGGGAAGGRRAGPAHGAGAAELTPREETALLWGLAVQPTRRPQNIELLIGQLCPAPPKKPVKRKKPEKPGGAGKVKAGKVSAKRIIGLAAAAIVLVVALVLIFGEGKEPSYGSPAYEPGGSIPAASASPTPEPTPTFTPGGRRLRRRGVHELRATTWS